ncbi:MAG: AraC family transcriptional regulator [Ruminococcus sp.]|nr:AraC family transcriptional regulator [Ruminococcus sp.]
MNIRCAGFGSVYDNDYIYRRKPEKGGFLLLLSKSRISIYFDGKKAVLPENTLILYDGSRDIEYHASGEYLICHWISFEAEDDAEFLEPLELSYNLPVRFVDTELIEQLMRNITSEFYSANTHRLKMTDVMLKTILMKLSEQCGRREQVQPSSNEPHYGLLIELREKIYRNPQKKWNVDLMAADVNMSRSYFQHIYREVFGVSCMTDVISGKIEKAKEILTETGCTVSQVAAMCGYENEEHFMRQFKKIVGVTPTGYRKR